MEIHERIKLRRKEINLTADDVAAALGVSRATVYRYESKDIEKLPLDIVEPLARVLRCSVAYIMGWTDSISDQSTAAGLSDDEAALIDVFRKLNPVGREKLKERADELFDLGYVLKRADASAI